MPNRPSSNDDTAARILVATATFNEIQTLPCLVETILRLHPTWDVLVVDDDSPDGTGQWCRDVAQREPRVKLIERPGKLGVGSAVQAAMRYAVQHRYDWLLNLDADLSHDPKYLADLLERGRPSTAQSGAPADVVVASRYIAHGGVRNWPAYRRWMSWWVNQMSRWLLGLKTADCSGSFRAYRVSLLASLPLDDVRSTGYLFFEEILWRLQRQGARIVEVPYVFVDRKDGKSKTGPREIWRAFLSLVQLVALRLRNR